MRATVDKAGRLVIPAEVRNKAGLRPGTELEVVLDDVSIRLIPCVAGPALERSDGRWIARPTVPPNERTEIDVAALIDEERNRWPW